MENHVDRSSIETRIDMTNLPSNSNNRKLEERDIRKNNPVIKGKVIVKKKTLWAKFAETFIGEDFHKVIDYMIYEVVVPAVKSTVVDGIQGGVERLILGGTRQTPSSRRDRERENGRSIINYGKPNDRYQERARDNRSRGSHDFGDIVLDSEREANDVLDHLLELIDRYNTATVADLYELVNIKADHIDRKWGWTSLSSATVTGTRNSGYRINLPRTILLE